MKEADEEEREKKTTTKKRRPSLLPLFFFLNSFFPSLFPPSFLAASLHTRCVPSPEEVVVFSPICGWLKRGLTRGARRIAKKKKRRKRGSRCVPRVAPSITLSHFFLHLLPSIAHPSPPPITHFLPKTRHARRETIVTRERKNQGDSRARKKEH